MAETEKTQQHPPPAAQQAARAGNERERQAAQQRQSYHEQQKEQAGAQKKVRVEVRARRENGFSRAGVRFGPDPLEYELTEEQLNLVENEPMLAVRRLDGAKRSPGGAEPSVSADPADTTGHTAGAGTMMEGAPAPGEEHRAKKEPPATQPGGAGTPNPNVPEDMASGDGNRATNYLVAGGRPPQQRR